MVNKTEEESNARWVDECITGLRSPDWRSDVERALIQAQDQERRRKQRWRTVIWTSLSITAAFLVVLSIPPARARAQLILQRILLRGIQMTGVRPDLYSALLFEWTVRPIPAHMVIGPDVAAREAGFEPNLPDWSMVSQPVQAFGIGVMGAGAGHYYVSVADLRSALTRAGASDFAIPDKWDGVEIGVEISPTVYVESRGFLLIQFLPGHISIPAGFDLSRFFEALLRIGGLSEPDARTLAAKIGPNPQVLLGIPSNSNSQFNIREVTLNSSTGVLVENTTGQDPRPKCVLCPGPREIVLGWQTAVRVYVMKTELNEANALAVANSLP